MVIFRSTEALTADLLLQLKIPRKNNIKKSMKNFINTILIHNNSKSQLTYWGEVVKNSNIIINSPLEGISAITDEGHNYLVLLTTYSFILNLLVAYLIALSLFIFTVRYVINSESLVEKINNNGSIPRWLKMFLTKSINTWTYTSNFWIYLFLITAFLGSLVSAMGMHTCLYVLSQFTSLS